MSSSLRLRGEDLAQLIGGGNASANCTAGSLVIRERGYRMIAQCAAVQLSREVFRFGVSMT